MSLGEFPYCFALRAALFDNCAVSQVSCGAAALPATPLRQRLPQEPKCEALLRQVQALEWRLGPRCISLCCSFLCECSDGPAGPGTGPEGGELTG